MLQTWRNSLNIGLDIFICMVSIIFPSKTTTVRGITLTAAHSGSIWKFAMQAKGQLISECLLGFIVWTKIPTKKFPRFLP